MAAPTARTARERARAEITGEILAAARRQLDEVGAGALSLRAVARDVGMVSSAVYRYFPSRDDLLTALIISAYDALADEVERADATFTRRSDLEGRWLASCRAVRSWALAHPQEWALIFGSPVPGYAAPVDTIGPATRTSAVLVGVLVDGVASGDIGAGGERVPAPVRADLRALAQQMGVDLPPAVVARGLIAWTHLVGAVSFELFGQRNNVIGDHDAFFDHEMRQIGRFIGL